MKKYEYKRIMYDPNDRELNELGSDGWELVSVTVVPSGYSSKSVLKTFYFKREKQPEPPKKDRDSFMYSSGI